MMNESIIKIQNTDTELQLLTCYLKEMYEDTKWNNRLIYFDPNYPNYLQNIINLDNNLFYWLRYGNETIGFMHLIIKENELYLNNIFLLKSFQNKKLAPKFIYTVINQYNKEFFSLNVFQSNDRALKWYLKLGMKIHEDTFFYEAKNSDANSEGYYIRDDSAGFKSVFIGENKIATVINDQSVMLHDPNIMLNFKNYNFVITKSNEMIISDNLSLWDISHKMLISTPTVLRNLK